MSVTIFPEIGSVWINNKKQTLYIVVYHGTHSETDEPLVIYQECNPNRPKEVWCRPLILWFQKFTPIENYKTKAITDKREIDLKINDLQIFLLSSMIPVEDDEKKLMRQQLLVMQTYSELLQARIENFNL